MYSIFSGYVAAEMDHSAIHHQIMMNETAERQLNQAGNDVFATIQEVIKKLDNNPNTDWSKINIEALRRHLLDMNDMALHVEVIS